MVQWRGLPLKDTSWEDLEDLLCSYPNLHLEDKVFVNTGKNDTNSEQMVPESTEKEGQLNLNKGLPWKSTDNEDKNEQRDDTHHIRGEIQ